MSGTPCRPGSSRAGGRTTSLEGGGGEGRCGAYRLDAVREGYS